MIYLFAAIGIQQERFSKSIWPSRDPLAFLSRLTRPGAPVCSKVMEEISQIGQATHFKN